MGLDMYAIATKQTVTASVDFEVEEAIEFYNWRKHPNLHGWMEALYYEKDGKNEFNRVPVVLTADDLDRLVRDIEEDNLPFTEGHCFSTSQGDEMEGDLDFVKKACELIAEGHTVFYCACW